MYVHTQSNHPPTIIKHIPSSISRRISTLSSNKDVFDKAATDYNAALNSSGYEENIAYVKTDKNNVGKKRTRGRKVTWFNPPYSLDVKTNIGKTFLKLADRHFPPGSTLHQIFNRHTLKVSYSCTTNMRNLIKSHNSRVIQNNNRTSTAQKSCNCRKKDACPLRGNCLVKSVVYKATVSTIDSSQTYIGISGGEFKTRFNNHNKSFRHQKYENETELSKAVWTLKRRNQDFNIQWDIIKCSNKSMRKSGICNLCLDEKVEIVNNKSINKRTELISTCRHHKAKPSIRVKKK